jgi:hypothetical protein
VHTVPRCERAEIRRCFFLQRHINNCDNGKESIDHEIDFAIGKLLLKQPL